MKTLSIAGAVLIAIAGTASARLPNPAPAYSAAHTRVRAINQDFERSVGALRTQYLARRSANGGTLSVADRDMMQRRYDGLYADYRRKLRNENPWSVDASGHVEPNFASSPPLSPGTAPVYSN